MNDNNLIEFVNGSDFGLFTKVMNDVYEKNLAVFFQTGTNDTIIADKAMLKLLSTLPDVLKNESRKAIARKQDQKEIE